MTTDKREELVRALLESGFGSRSGEKGSSEMVLDQLLEQLGIGAEDWETWLREGGLTEEIVGLARAKAGVHAAQVWGTLLRLTEEGSVPAIRLYMDLWKERGNGGGTAGTAGADAAVAGLRQEIFGKE